MAELINMPKLGFDMKEGQLINWSKQVGDPVEKGDILAEIESDKATIEVEAFTSGTLLEVLVHEGDWVPIGAPIAVIGEAGEKVDLAALGVEEKGEAEPAAVADAPASAVDAKASAPEPEAAAPTMAADTNGKGLPGGVRASPLARRIAEDRGIDLKQVPGSGPMGRVVRDDVESFTPSKALTTPSAPAAPAGTPITIGATPVVVGPDDEVIPTPRMRARIGQRMVEAKLQAPHFYITTSIDMGAALSLRKEINEKLEAKGIKVSVNDMAVKAAALALVEYPNLNAAFNGDTIVKRGHVNIGIAVALDDGLINVVSKDADRASLSAMAANHRDMILRAREGKIRPEDVEGETFAISNLGAWDVEHFAAIINPPSAAILALATAQQVPVVDENGEIVVGWQMKATLSGDHRVTDGAEGAAFLQEFKQILEDPIRLLV
ncbi:MAG: 2-oxo acid dehydrogenase subunit E2 [Anaerolineae bacterium]|nr:2-oxo acid dehydrogenase subunit E2 [Anaerolineae bacterium]